MNESQPASSGRGSARAVAPILGVHSTSGEQAIKNFAGGATHSEWLFTADALPVAVLMPGTLNLVRANAGFHARPFPPGLAPQAIQAPNLQQGTGPGGLSPQRNPIGQAPAPSTRSRSNRPGRSTAPDN